MGGQGQQEYLPALFSLFVVRQVWKSSSLLGHADPVSGETGTLPASAGLETEDLLIAHQHHQAGDSEHCLRWKINALLAPPKSYKCDGAGFSRLFFSCVLFVLFFYLGEQVFFLHCLLAFEAPCEE